jgi:hypothetical protein
MSTQSYSPIGNEQETEDNLAFHCWAVFLLFFLTLAILGGGVYLTAVEIGKGSVNAGWAGMLTLVFASASFYFLRASVLEVMGVKSDEHRPR